MTKASEGRTPLGLWFQRSNSPLLSQWGSMPADRPGSTNNTQSQEENSMSELEMMLFFKISNLAPVTCILQEGHIPVLPKQSQPTEDQVFKCQRPWTTYIIETPTSISVQSPLLWEIPNGAYHFFFFVSNLSVHQKNFQLHLVAYIFGNTRPWAPMMSTRCYCHWSIINYEEKAFRFLCLLTHCSYCLCKLWLFYITHP